MLYMYWMLDTLFFFFFNDTATTEIYTLSLHDALPISPPGVRSRSTAQGLLDGPPRENAGEVPPVLARRGDVRGGRSEEHTSELQSRQYLVCRLLLEKKKKLYLLVYLYTTRNVCGSAAP